ncbi:MAG: ChbG/HpnK family deacetylase [Burkholderiaceae bacterium]|nr:ChbG/HpnK family deacetylase [Burkholderiaceae bacterium]
MKQVKEKHIVLCADDFGMNQAVNDGIVALAGQGRLSATTCLVGGPAFRSGAPALLASGLRSGLHLNFTESMGQAGLYMPVSYLIRHSMLRQLDVHQLRAQIDTQLDQYEDAMGQAPAFVDGHQHVHQFAQIRTELLHALDRRYPQHKPRLRYTWPARLTGTPIAQRLKAHIIGALGARPFAALARQQGYPMNRAFLGVYDFAGGPQGYAVLLQAWLQTVQDGDMVMCHPAARVQANDSLGAQRYAEFQVLGSPDLGDWLSAYGVRL